MRFNARFDGDLSTEALLQRFGFEEHGRTQMAIDKRVIDLTRDYWAFDTGALANSAYTASDIGSGTVLYPGPYAHYQYYGIVYGPNIPIFDDNTGETYFLSPALGKGSKHPTNRKLTYKKDHNPLAGAYPFERMKADHLNDIVEEARRVALDE